MEAQPGEAARPEKPDRGRVAWSLRELLATAPPLVLVVLLLLDQVDLVEPFDAWPLGGWASELDGFLVLAIFSVVASTVFATWRLRAIENQTRRLRVAERTLAETSQRYGSLFDYHLHAVFELDLSGRFGEVNAVSERVSGYTRHELQGMELSQLVAPDRREWVLGLFRGVLDREPLQAELSIIRKDGTTRELSVTGLPIIVGNEVVGAYGIGEDITERNRLERELEEARRAAEAANEAKSVFLANVSHELRTPLTGVLGANEMLSDLDLEPEGARLARIVDRSGQRLLRLVNDLLDFAKIEAGKTDLERVPVSVRSLVDEVISAAAPGVDGSSLVLSHAVDAAVPRDLVGDPTRIAQVLTNLVDNAVKFTAAGEVTLSVEVASVDAEAVELLLQVRDTGIGLSPEEQSRLFQSFSQADSSITRKYGGTGLGLAISHQLVELMGGSIRVESSPGRGSTFSVLLPMVRASGRD